jgi:hypothetical protein
MTTPKMIIMNINALKYRGHWETNPLLCWDLQGPMQSHKLRIPFILPGPQEYVSWSKYEVTVSERFQDEVPEWGMRNFLPQDSRGSWKYILLSP